MKSILIIAAHPDDEVLGGGGAITKLAGQGAQVRVAFLADGIFSPEGSTLGISAFFFSGFS